MTNKYTWEEQKKIVKDYFKLIRKKTMTTDKPNKLVQATNILEMVLLGASELTNEITKQNLKDEDYKRIKRHIKNGYKFLKEYYDNR
jgi:predicted glycosyl hydrolase (DUF1957 family)